MKDKIIIVRLTTTHNYLRPCVIGSKNINDTAKKMTQAHGVTEITCNNYATKCYQTPVESKTFSTLEVEDELLIEEMTAFAPRTADAHEGNNTFPRARISQSCLVPLRGLSIHTMF